MSIAVHFSDILREGFAVIDAAVDKSGDGRRLRVLPITNRALRYLYAGKLSAGEFLAAIKRRLPNDATLVSVDGALWRSAEGNSKDLTELIFQSREWPPVAKGAPLPELERLIVEEVAGQWTADRFLP